jgi:hypothetical protein
VILGVENLQRKAAALEAPRRVARVDDALVHDESDGRARLLVVLGQRRRLRDPARDTAARKENPAFSIDVSCRAGSSSASTPGSLPSGCGGNRRLIRQS